MAEGFGTTAHEQNRVQLVRPGAITIDRYADPVFGRLERVFQERVRADTIHQRAALCGQFEALRVEVRAPDGHCDLTPGYRQGLHERPGRWFPQPVADLVVEGLGIVRLDDPGVIAQPIIELRTV